MSDYQDWKSHQDPDWRPKATPPEEVELNTLLYEIKNFIYQGGITDEGKQALLSWREAYADKQVLEAEADMARHIARLAELCAEPREEELSALRKVNKGEAV